MGRGPWELRWWRTGAKRHTRREIFKARNLKPTQAIEPAMGLCVRIKRARPSMARLTGGRQPPQGDIAPGARLMSANLNRHRTCLTCKPLSRKVKRYPALNQWLGCDAAAQIFAGNLLTTASPTDWPPPGLQWAPTPSAPLLLPTTAVPPPPAAARARATQSSARWRWCQGMGWATCRAGRGHRAAADPPPPWPWPQPPQSRYYRG